MLCWFLVAHLSAVHGGVVTFCGVGSYIFLRTPLVSTNTGGETYDFL